MLPTIGLPDHRRALQQHSNTSPAHRQIARLELDLALQGHPHPEPEARRLFAAMAKGVAL